MEPEVKVIKIIIKVGLLVACLVIIGTIASHAVKASRLNCSSFISRQDAQAMYTSSPSHYRFLDRDHDGKVCESRK